MFRNKSQLLIKSFKWIRSCKMSNKCVNNFNTNNNNIDNEFNLKGLLKTFDYELFIDDLCNDMIGISLQISYNLVLY